MKILRIIGILFFFYLLFYSCSKDKNISSSSSPNSNTDTIFPKSYFPAYPGSWWIYSNGDTMKVDKYIDVKYCKYDYKYQPPVYEEYIFPQIINKKIFPGNDTAIVHTVYVKGYSISTCGGTCGSYFVPILCDPSGNCGEGYWDSFSGHKWAMITWKNDTSININSTTYNNTLITLQWDAGYFGYDVAQSHWMAREFYSKDIGLIRRDEKNTPFDTTFTTSFSLINYHINK